LVRTEAGSYLRLIDSCITQLEAQGRSRTCNESKEEEEGVRTTACDEIESRPIAPAVSCAQKNMSTFAIQGYLAHKKQPPPLEPHHRRTRQHGIRFGLRVRGCGARRANVPVHMVDFISQNVFMN